MINHRFSIDYTCCPKGHRWIFIPSSTLYSDTWYCEDCECLYEPSVRKIKKGNINKNFHTDREADILKRGKFLKWKDKLTYKDMD